MGKLLLSVIGLAFALSISTGGSNASNMVALNVGDTGGGAPVDDHGRPPVTHSDLG